MIDNNPVKRTIIEIPAVKCAEKLPFNRESKRKVGAYARVSTEKDMQCSSYEAQIKHYTEYIKDNPEWSFVKVYTDDGITGTSTKNRKGFEEMVVDALSGKLDLIITKSVSRFARNTVDSLVTIRKLKEANCEIFFEKENIWTFDGKGELLLTIMSSLAQEESRSISQNVTWGMRERARNGKTHLAYSKFLGYDKGVDGRFEINENQALLVKRIYGLFLFGLSPYAISRKLIKEGVKTAGNTEKWYPSTIYSILTNEKYVGDCLIQKTYKIDFLSKRRIVNDGAVSQYYVKNDHPAIITKEIQNIVKNEIIERKDNTRRHSSVNVFCGKVQCSVCGKIYGPKPSFSKTRNCETVWKCRHKNLYGAKWNSVVFNNSYITGLFSDAINRLYPNMAEIIETVETTIQKVISAINMTDSDKRWFEIHYCLMNFTLTTSPSSILDQSIWSALIDKIYL